VSGEATAACSECGQPASADDRYCEACGAPLTPGIVVDVPDRREFDGGVVAGVTDRGLVHRRNEDAMHVALVDDGIVAIVCDGVSSAASAADASSAAAEAAGRVLTASFGALDDDGTGPMRDAMTAAQDAVLDVPWTRTRRRGAPACTFLGARWDGREITVGAVGDCRAYWIDAQGVKQLTVDDSWVQEQVDNGQLSAADAQQHPYAHAITRWLGEDAPGGAPRVTTFTPPAAGRLVLCSDGLWNYAPTDTRMGALVRAHPPATPPIEVARALTQIALASGGRDNITVVVVDVAPSTVIASNGEAS
jgi:serine/threonine protein phosphatase PrpC